MVLARKFYFIAALSLFMAPISPIFAADYDDGNGTSKTEAFFAKVKTLGKLRDGQARACDDEKITKKIHRHFAVQAKQELKHPKLAINSLTAIHQHRFEPSDEERQIARRYCGATAHLNNGQVRDVWYIIEDGMGMASLDDGVTYCVSGYDRWYVHNGACRITR